MTNRERATAAAPILAVFTHPDDDILVGPLMAHYAKRGVDVYLALVTSGQEGAQERAGIPAGEKLGRVREQEARKACEAYGIHAPFFFREWDGKMGSQEKWWERRERFRQCLGDVIAKTHAGILITFGPAGYNGNPDHRMVSSLVTEYCMHQGAEQFPSFRKLYHTARGPSEADKGQDTVVQRDFITTVVDCSDGIEEAKAAIACYESQFSPERIAKLQAAVTPLLANTHLILAAHRACEVALPESDLFAGI